MQLTERAVLAFESIADSLRAMSQAGDWTDMRETVPVMTTRLPNESKCMRAMKLLAEMGPDNLTAIAAAVGVNRRTLYRWPTFVEAVDRLRGAQTWTPRDPRAARFDEL